MDVLPVAEPCSALLLYRKAGSSQAAAVGAECDLGEFLFHNYITATACRETFGQNQSSRAQVCQCPDHFQGIYRRSHP